MDLKQIASNVLNFQRTSKRAKKMPEFVMGPKPGKPNLAEIKIGEMSIEAAAQTLFEAIGERQDCWGFGFVRDRNGGTVIVRTDGERATKEQIEKFIREYWERALPDDFEGKTSTTYVKWISFCYPQNFPASQKTEWREVT